MFHDKFQNPFHESQPIEESSFSLELFWTPQYCKEDSMRVHEEWEYFSEVIQSIFNSYSF